MHYEQSAGTYSFVSWESWLRSALSLNSFSFCFWRYSFSFKRFFIGKKCKNYRLDEIETINVGDRCWRRNVLMTPLRCFCHQHLKLSQSESHQHDVVTNITLADFNSSSWTIRNEIFLNPDFDAAKFFAPFLTSCDHTINQVADIGFQIDALTLIEQLKGQFKSPSKW